MTTFVLVHGAWHGGWCWRRVARELLADGHRVYAPTLSGLGERARLLTPRIDLETHVRDVLAVLEADDLCDVVLVGHSYGGVVATAVADRVPQRIARLVYLAAVVPRNGEALYDRAPPRVRARFDSAARQRGDGWRLPADVATARLLGLARPDDARFVMARLTAHPLRTLREPVQLRAEAPPVPRSYVACTGAAGARRPERRRSMQADGIDDYHELQAGHDAMVSAAGDVAALLRRLASPRR